ncbi:unnamed protein product [Paramecium pentaurelia]|uniref:Transmembrane protein n=1 Tax=Paramecium pentaurelia TaxID=43138 RepID=A0A8S1VBB4_9CILI|nr:unnamed protein product [Paramecium pentaurelia]
MKNQNRKGKPKLGQVCSLILFKSCSYIQKVQEIVISLLFNFSFFKRQVRCNAIKSGVKEIENMFEIPSLNSCLNQLKKDYCIFQKGQQVMRKFFLFLKEISNISECKTKWSYNLNIEFHYSMAHANKYQYIQVFLNKAFEGFLIHSKNILISFFCQIPLLTQIQPKTIIFQFSLLIQIDNFLSYYFLICSQFTSSYEFQFIQYLATNYVIYLINYLDIYYILHILFFMSEIQHSII